VISLANIGPNRFHQYPNRLVADVDAPLEQNILDLSQRQWIADIHHHHEADHLGRAVEITEGIARRRRLRNLARRLKPIYSDNALSGARPDIVHRFPIEYLSPSQHGGDDATSFT